MKLIKQKTTVKRHFQLLEVMIALFLIACCAVPVLGTYVFIYKQQKEMRQIIEVDHIAYLLHAKITEDLYKQGINGASLKELLNKNFPMENLDPSLTKMYDFSYQLELNKSKPLKKKDREGGKTLLTLTIQADKKKVDHKEKPPEPRKYVYKIYVEREFKQGQDEFDSDSKKKGEEEGDDQEEEQTPNKAKKANQANKVNKAKKVETTKTRKNNKKSNAKEKTP